MIVLDTRAWIWHVDSPHLLSLAAGDAIRQARDSRSVYVSCISTWEIHMLVSKGRLAFSVDADVWVTRCERLSFLRFVPVDNEIARLAVGLPDPCHADPADRMIVATARYLGAALVTKDRRLRDYEHVSTVW